MELPTTPDKNIYEKNFTFWVKFFILKTYNVVRYDNLHITFHIYLIRVYIFSKNGVFHSKIKQNLFYLDFYGEIVKRHCIYYTHIFDIFHLYNLYTFVYAFV